MQPLRALKQVRKREVLKILMKAVSGIYSVLNKISNQLQRVLEFLIVLLVLSCAGDLVLQVVYRFVLVHITSWSCTWTTEYAQDALIWITYFMVGICLKEGSMASVNVIYDRLSGKGRLALYLLTRLIIVIFLTVGLKYGWDTIVSMSSWRSTNLHLPGWSLYGAPFLGCILMGYEVIVELFGVLCGQIEPFVGRPPREEELELTEEEKRELSSIEGE